jgi:phage shock protein PspC (stress-responsive transcriptional regulator)
MYPGVSRVEAVLPRRHWEPAARRAATWKEPEVASTLTRPRHGKVIAGVCAGLAERFGWSPFVVRLLFLLSCLLPGPQFVIYIVLWIIMPKRDY